MPYKDLTFLLFAKDVSASAGFEKVAASADRAATGIKASTGLIGLAVAGLAIDLGAKAVKMAADFQTATTRLVTDAGESSKNLGKVSDGILQISQTVGTSATDIAKGMYYVESAGYHGAAGLEVMRAAAEGAKVGGADLTTVADALTTVMKDYGVASGQSNNITSELIATVSRGKTTMEDLAGSLHSVLPNAQALHIPLNDVLGALATMTEEGISADQATQNLNHTIVSLANPTHVMSLQMGAMGLNSTTVAAQLGKRGITGTLNELVEAITKHMGPAGLVLQNSFNQSKLAAQSADQMLSKLSPQAQTLARAYEAGSISLKTWNTAVKGLPADQANLAKQWAADQNSAKGFSNALRSGSGSAQTFTSALAKMTGGQTGLQVALHITELHAKDTANNVAEIGKAARGTQKDVSDWATTQGTFNQKLSQAGATVQTVGIDIGKGLLPIVGDFLDAFSYDAVEIPKLLQGLGYNLASWWRDDFIGPVKHAIDFLGGLPHSFSVVGGQIIQGLSAGIRGRIGNVLSTIGGLAQMLPDWVRKILGIQSPSKVFHEIGTHIVAGLHKGLTGSESQVHAAAHRISNLLVKSLKHKEISKKAEKGGLVAVKAMTNDLDWYAEQRATNAKMLTEAKDKLKKDTAARDDLESATSSAAIGNGDITKAGVSGMKGTLTAMVSNTRLFTADLQKLAKMGLDSTSIKQLISAGVGGGGLKAAQDLLANPVDVKQIAALQGQLASASQGLGVEAGDLEYGSTIKDDQQQVTNLTNNGRDLAREQQATAARDMVHIEQFFAGSKSAQEIASELAFQMRSH